MERQGSVNLCLVCQAKEATLNQEINIKRANLTTPHAAVTAYHTLLGETITVIGEKDV